MIEFFLALWAIIVIDLVLAGDNAIVIALAARSLPPKLQRRAILWGCLGAIVVRGAMSMAAVWLLQVPGLMFVGGALLFYIAYKLVRPDKSEDDGSDEGQELNFYAAVKTIVIADATMGLDNVLGVAGVANGSYLLVLLGLLISVPILLFGSAMILKLMEKHPWVVYVGAGILFWTSAAMMAGDKWVYGYLGSLTALFYVPGAFALSMVIWEDKCAKELT